MRNKSKLKIITDNRLYNLYKLESLGYWSRKERKFYKRNNTLIRCWKDYRKNQWHD